MQFFHFVVTTVYLNFLSDFSRYFAAAGVMFGLITLWKITRRTERKIRRDFPLLRQMRREILNSARSVVVFSATSAAVLYVMAAIGLDPSRALHDKPGPIYFAFSVLALFLAHDTYFYWTHRAMHHRWFFRIFHLEHHRSHNPSPWAAYSFSMPEAVIQAAFTPLYIAVVPTSLAALLVFIIGQITLNVIGHSGFEVFPQPLVKASKVGLLTGATHHDIHHAISSANYGLYFRIWDRLMGTEHPRFEDIYLHVRSKENRSDAYAHYLHRPITQKAAEDAT